MRYTVPARKGFPHGLSSLRRVSVIEFNEEQFIVEFLVAFIRLLSVTLFENESETK